MIIFILSITMVLTAITSAIMKSQELNSIGVKTINLKVGRQYGKNLIPFGSENQLNDKFDSNSTLGKVMNNFIKMGGTNIIPANDIIRNWWAKNSSSNKFDKFEYFLFEMQYFQYIELDSNNNSYDHFETYKFLIPKYIITSGQDFKPEEYLPSKHDIAYRVEEKWRKINLFLALIFVAVIIGVVAYLFLNH